MSPTTKRSVLIFLVLSLVSIFILAASLSGMPLRAGSPFPGSAGSQDGIDGGMDLPPGTSLSLPVTQGIFTLILLILVIQVWVRLMARLDFKKIIRPVFLLAIVLVILGLLPRFTAAPAISTAEEAAENPIAQSAEVPVTPLGDPPVVFTWLVLAGILAGLVIVVIALSRRAPSPGNTKDKLQQEAASALDALNAGQSFKDVIVRCYMQMAQVLLEEQGLQRREPMTVSEFERLLAGSGLPLSPVHQLTRLFEQVRYGRQPASEADQQLGIVCLDEIMRYCQGEKG